MTWVLFPKYRGVVGFGIILVLSDLVIEYIEATIAWAGITVSTKQGCPTGIISHV